MFLIKASLVNCPAPRQIRESPRDYRGLNVLYFTGAGAQPTSSTPSPPIIFLLNAATYDGDTPVQERWWVREHANSVLTTPDMLNYEFWATTGNGRGLPALCGA